MYQSYHTIFTGLAGETADFIAFKVLGDNRTQRIQAGISLEQFGNAIQQARQYQSHVTFGHFGIDSQEDSILGSETTQERSAKRKQLLLDNALRLGHLPKPRGPR